MSVVSFFIILPLICSCVVGSLGFVELGYTYRTFGDWYGTRVTNCLLLARLKTIQFDLI